MTAHATTRRVVATLIAALVIAVPVLAQVTTGIVTGTIRDEQGAVIPGATVVLLSAARGTRAAETVTNENGDFVFPNVTADTYVVEIMLEGFRPARREGINVSAGDRVAVPTLTLTVGTLTESVVVTVETPLVQAVSGERSFTVPTESVQNLPLADRNFARVALLVPGVGGPVGGANVISAAGGVSRLGGGGQNNIMMDGLSTMDTGNNGQNITMNTEGIAEVKIMTQGYQAEYGRSSGLQITAVTKGGSNQFRGSLYTYERRSDWNSNSWVNIQNGDPKPVQNQRDWGYSIGGPVGKPGRQNKLFFFYSHEYRPRTTGGNINRFRVPTPLERQGDFSQSRDNLGQLFPFIRDASTGLPCGPTDTRGCFQDGGVVGRIPANRLYATGLSLLNRWNLPNRTQGPGENYNLEITAPVIDTTSNQSVMRVDYQLSPNLRAMGKYAGQWAPRVVTPGTMPGVNDTINWNPNRHAPSATVNYTMTPTTFIEASYGYSFNEIDIIFANEAANRLNGLAGLPMLFPTAGQVHAGSHAESVLTDANGVYFQNGTVLLPPVFTWGNRIGPANALPAPPNWAFALINVNPSHDLTASVTKLLGRHTVKAGYYWNHAFKAQQEQLGATTAIRWQGDLDFGNNTANPLDTGFGFSNAAVGVYNQYSQRSFLVEGNYVYNSHDFYIQDNWRVNNRLTLDYGVRFEHMQPTYDTLLQGSTFFPDQRNASEAPLLYAPACVGGVNPCSGNNRQAMDPRTGVLQGPGSAALIGQLVPNSGNPYSGIVRQGDGISDYGYTWPTWMFTPRFGAAYHLTGDEGLILRGSLGLFHDRPSGDTAYNQATNPPFNTSRTVRFGLLQELSSSSQGTQGPAALASIWPYESEIPASVQWNVEVQAALPWASTVSVAYVGQYGYSRLPEIRGQNQVDINAPDIGAAFLPQNQDPTLAPSTIAGATALTDDFLRPFRGYASIGVNVPEFHETFHGIQTGWNRRFRDGVSFGATYNLTLSHTGNIQTQFGALPALRLEHAPDGSYSVRADQAEYEELNKNMGTPRHVLRLNGVWDLPDLPRSSTPLRVIGAVLNDWQISGVFTGGSGGFYDVAYAYQGGISNRNLTGSPTYPARVVITGDPGSGCTDDPYRQFTTTAFSGPLPGSLGLESGRNTMVGCADHTLDLAIARNIRLGGFRNVQLRVDLFNALNTVVYNARNTTVQLNSPTDQTVRNSQYLPDGTVDPTRLLPRNAGFGAVTGAQPLRSVQAQIRFQF